MNHQADAHELLVFSISLRNWVVAAERSLAMPIATRISRWNLDCVGEFGIPVTAWIENSSPDALFSINNRTLYVYGAIDAGFFERFRSRLDDSPDVDRVSLGSGGGSVRDAILSVIEIRRRGLSTTIYGNCFSACPLLFAGGEERTLWASGHRLGFHQIYEGDGQPVPVSDPIYRAVSQYLLSMGVDDRTLIGWMLSAGPEEIYEPEVRDLCSPRIATWVQRVCGP